METNNKNAAVSEMEKEYQSKFLPSVHNIGQATMIIGVLLALLPVAFMYFVCGWDDIPLTTYAALIAYLIPLLGIRQFTEHLRFYPMMGSAATYISYLSGNSTGIRIPVANSCASEFDADVLSPYGQIVAIIGVGISVVSNILVLLMTVAFGDVVLSIVPKVVIDALGYITIVIFGYLLILNIRNAGGGSMSKGAIHSWPMYIVAVVGWIVFKKFLNSPLYVLWIMLSAIVVCIAMEMAKDKQAQS